MPEQSPVRLRPTRGAEVSQLWRLLNYSKQLTRHGAVKPFMLHCPTHRGNTTPGAGESRSVVELRRAEARERVAGAGRRRRRRAASPPRPARARAACEDDTLANQLR
ncbi:unnamed protein product [Spodoptera exigua]|nr:unnamed protein product [Spodoptera exigua]